VVFAAVDDRQMVNSQQPGEPVRRERTPEIKHAGGSALYLLYWADSAPGSMASPRPDSQLRKCPAPDRYEVNGS